MTIPAAAPTAEAAGRSARLDGLRGLAILPVMLYHLTFYGYAVTPLDRILTFLPSLGWTSVDLFFVLSGYLITGILRGTRGSSHYFRTFYARRALRIFPLYYAVLFFFFVLAPRLAFLGDPAAFWVSPGEQETLWYWLYLQNLKVAFTGRFDHHFLGIVWTLCIEEQFYLAWPLLVLLASRRRLIRLCVGLMGGAFLLRLGLVLAGAPKLTLLTFTFCRIDTLAAGSLIAILFERPEARSNLTRIARRGLPVAVGLWLATVLWASYQTHVALPAGVVLTPDQRALQATAFTGSPWIQTLGFEFALAFYAGLLICTLTAAGGSGLVRWLETGFMRSFGKYSYAMYLLHVFLAEFARILYDPNRTSLPFVVEQLLWWVVAVGLSYGVAALSWYAFESRFLRLKRFFPMERTVPAGASRSLGPQEGLE